MAKDPTPSLLETIDYPFQLRELKPDQLQPLADEVRGFIINSISNLGFNKYLDAPAG